MVVRLNAKYVVFSGIAVMMAYVLYHNERFLIEPANPIWQHYAHFKWWLLPQELTRKQINPGGTPYAKRSKNW